MKLNKLRSKCNTSFFFISFLFLLTSCQTFSLVPGRSKKIFDNIYVEYARIGDTYYNLNDYTNAIKYYNMSLPNKDSYWDVYCKLAKTYAITSNWDEALPMYRRLLKRDPDNSSIKASIAYIYSMQGSTKKAKKIYKELLEIEPENEKYLENYIALYLIDKKTYLKNVETVNELLKKLQTYYIDNKNIDSFNSRIKEFTQEDENIEDFIKSKEFEDSEETDDENTDDLYGLKEVDEKTETDENPESEKDTKSESLENKTNEEN